MHKIKLRLQLLFAISTFCFFVEGNSQDINLKCAEIFNLAQFSGKNLSVLAESQFLNLEEDFVPFLANVWNETTQSFKVENGCLFTACNESFFNGHCVEFKASNPQLPSDFGKLMSLNCTCAENCKCEDFNNLRKKECARAYIHGKGCDSCHPLYTVMEGIKDEWSPDFAPHVKSIMVREGCEVRVFSNPEFEGNEQILSGIVHNWTTPVESFDCACGETDDVPKPPKIRKPHWPELLDIPDTLEEIEAMLKNHPAHPGLLAAHESVRNKRSARKAFILLLGSTGSGKSTAINMLFDNPNVTKVGDAHSTTVDVHEFRIPITVDELGIRNAELRVIDTPGLGDTRGLHNDAIFLATLEQFLESHEELKFNVPNVVLIFHKFTDNRYNGTGSQFVKMLRGLDSFKERITDKKYSNVVFVFSHFMGERKDTTRKPSGKLGKFKRVIDDYALFPKPTVLVVAENKPVEEDLPLFNGYYKLPNGDFYPRNLFDKIQQVTSGGGDPVGNAVIRTAFRDPDDFNITSTGMTVVHGTNSRVEHYNQILLGAVYNVNDTEVSQILSKAYEKMDPELKKRFPDALLYTQKALNLRNIPTRKEIPRTTIGIVKLYQNLRKNDAVLFLLEEAFDLRPPAFPYNSIAGFSYNVFKDEPLSTSPYQLGNLKDSEAGYKFPDILTCSIEGHRKDIFHPLKTRGEYVQMRLRDLGLDGSFNPEYFTGAVKTGYNILSPEQADASNETVTALKEFRTFQLVINDMQTLHPDFVRAIRALTPYNEGEQSSVDQWKAFFENYGTHVVKSVYGGGAMKVRVKMEADALLNIMQYAEGIPQSPQENSNISLTGANTVPHTITFLGGNEAFHVPDLSKFSRAESSRLIEQWQDSLSLSPVILSTEIKLLPLSEIAKKVGQNISSEIQRATNLLFDAQLKYTPPPSARNSLPGAARGDTPEFSPMNDVLKQMLADSKAQQEAMQAMLEKLFEQQRKSEESKVQMQKEMMEWQKKENELRREYELEQRESEKRRLEDERKRAEEERNHRMQMAERQRAADAARQQEMDRLREQHKKEMRDMINNMPKPQVVHKKGGCLRKGTKILMADWSEKPVEDIEQGDLILNGELQSTIVLAKQKKFLFSDTFHSFGNSSFFFTDSHMFIGKSEDDDKQIFVHSLPRLLEENPLMSHFSPQEFSSKTRMHRVDKAGKAVETIETDVRRDPAQHPETTEVYILTVADPKGTYIANGFISRHEVPPLEEWKNTMDVLFSLVEEPEVLLIAKMEYNMENVKKIQESTEKLLEKLENEIQGLEEGEAIYEEGKWFEQSEDENLIAEIFGNPTLSAWAFSVYAKIGPVLANELDNKDGLSGKNLEMYKVHFRRVIAENMTEIFKDFF